MKAQFITLLTLTFSFAAHGALENQCSFPIGKQAPDFSAQAVVGNKVQTLSLNDLHGAYKVLIFYPKDFTFVCPTELLAFQAQLPEFKKRNVDLVAFSTDPAATHKKWLATPVCKGGVEDVTFPLVADPQAEIIRKYGVLNEANGLALRGLFILDAQNTIRIACVNDDPVGRNVNEVLRSIDALENYKKNGVVCPAKQGPETGDPNLHGFKPTHAGLIEHLKKQEENK